MTFLKYFKSTTALIPSERMNDSLKQKVNCSFIVIFHLFIKWHCIKICKVQMKQDTNKIYSCFSIQWQLNVIACQSDSVKASEHFWGDCQRVFQPQHSLEKRFLSDRIHANQWKQKSPNYLWEKRKKRSKTNQSC